jgi:hypothetical protein
MKVVIHGTFEHAALAMSTDRLVSTGSGGCNESTAQAVAKAGTPFTYLLQLHKQESVEQLVNQFARPMLAM